MGCSTFALLLTCSRLLRNHRQPADLVLYVPPQYGPDKQPLTIPLGRAVQRSVDRGPRAGVITSARARLRLSHFVGTVGFENLRVSLVVRFCWLKHPASLGNACPSRPDTRTPPRELIPTAPCARSGSTEPSRREVNEPPPSLERHVLGTTRTAEGVIAALQSL
jgi:hypothetical protein